MAIATLPRDIVLLERFHCRHHRNIRGNTCAVPTDVGHERRPARDRGDTGE